MVSVQQTIMLLKHTVLLHFLMCIDFSLMSITLSKLTGGPTLFGFQITFYGATRRNIRENV